MKFGERFRTHALRLAVVVILTAAIARAVGPCASDPVGQLFPANNPWNVDISSLPVLSNSAQMVAGIGSATSLHPDFGTVYAGAPWGIPFVVVDGTQPYVPINFTAYGDESDPGPYPAPLSAPVEGGANSTGDRHVLVYDTSNRFVYEMFAAVPQASGWNADSGAVFDGATNARRPLGWTSADAAGLSILGGLARYEEVQCGGIRHAIRFTVQRTRKAYIYPASHFASSSTDPNLPAMGQRFRLKASFDMSGFSGQARVVLQALKTYGMIVADNGSNWYISGAPSPGWNDTEIDTLKRVHGSDFEAVDTSSLVPPSDSVAPVGPTGLSVTAASSTQLNATWAAASDNTGVIAYRITVSTNANFSSSLPLYTNAFLGNAMSAMLTGLNPSTTYYVRMVAYDEAGNKSAGATGSSTTLAGSGGSQPPSGGGQPPSGGGTPPLTTPSDFSVVNAATFQALLPVAPGGLASLFITSTGATQTYFADSVPLPRSLGGVTLSIGGTLSATTAGWSYSANGAQQAPLLFVGPGQINFQVPMGLMLGSSVAAQLRRADGSTALTTLQLAPSAPGVFTTTINGQGQAAALNQDYSQNSAANPARRGSVIQIYATGPGDISPALNAGESAPANGIPLIRTQAQPTVMIGGVQATVQFSGIAPGFVGLWQINAVVPSVQPGTAVPVAVTIGGVTAATVTIAVQ